MKNKLAENLAFRNAPSVVINNKKTALREVHQLVIALQENLQFKQARFSVRCELVPLLCRFNGVQRFPDGRTFELWTVHPGQKNTCADAILLSGSTVSAQTLRRAGFVPVLVLPAVSQKNFDRVPSHEASGSGQQAFPFITATPVFCPISKRKTSLASGRLTTRLTTKEQC